MTTIADATLKIPGFSRYRLLLGGEHGWTVVGVWGRPLTISKSWADGRPQVALASPDSGKPVLYQLGKVVLLAHAGKPPDEKRVFSLHRDGDPHNNEPDNLYWGTISDNAYDSIRHGTAACIRRGEDRPMTRIPDSMVAAIRAEYIRHKPGRPKGMPIPKPGGQRWLAEKYGIPQGYISAIINGKRR